MIHEDVKTVKWIAGLKLAQAGLHSFTETAARLGISIAYLSMILACVERPAEHQAALARLCRCRPSDIFGRWTQPGLLADERAGLWNPTATQKRKATA